MLGDARAEPRFPKPVLVLSQCLELEPCRYNGERIPFDLVRELEPWVEYRPVCPEVEIGLGVPRDTIRLSLYKFVLLAYGEKHLRELGRIVANAGRGPFAEVYARYRVGFMTALASLPRPRTFINVFQHIAGFFSDELTAGEKAHFGNLVARYRSGRTAASSVTSLLESWAVRFEAAYILDQAVFAPFPDALVSEADSGKGRRWRW